MWPQIFKSKRLLQFYNRITHDHDDMEMFLEVFFSIFTEIQNDRYSSTF